MPQHAADFEESPLMHSRQSPGAFHGAELLESRRLLSAVLTGTLLTIDGTANNDTVSVVVNSTDKTKYNVTINGKTTHFSRAAVHSIKIDTKEGNDKITIGTKPTAVNDPVTVLGGAGNDTVTGGNEADSIDGSDGNDVLTGGGGDDTITSGDGFDLSQGGLGDDSILGEGGDDLLYGDAGNDTLRGGDGNDTMGGDDEDIVFFLNKPIPADVAGNDLL